MLIDGFQTSDPRVSCECGNHYILLKDEGICDCGRVLKRNLLGMPKFKEVKFVFDGTDWNKV